MSLELGSNSPNIVFADANLDTTVESITKGGFAFAGQACISAQRIYVQSEVYQAFLDQLVSRVEQLQLGDPALETTDVGPMITEEAAIRTESWINEAKDQ